MPRILIVDDESSILDLLRDFLGGEGYETVGASHALEALEILERDARFDLVLSDINMPHMKGFEFLSRVEKKYPHIKRVLITSYSVEDYITLAIRYGTTNIATKSTPFNLDGILLLLNNLIRGTIFGLESYLAPGTPVVRLPVIHPESIHDYASKPIADLKIQRSARNLTMVLVELLNNAIYYGIKDMDPERKEDWKEDFTLNEGEVDLYYGADADKFAFAVSDNGGKLTKTKVLHWFRRQMEHDPSGLPLGLFDIHGRGLFISREYVDRLIVNLDRGRRTEIIGLVDRTAAFKGHKPLMINEI